VQRRRHLVPAGRPAGGGIGHHVAPPLQPHQGQQRRPRRFPRPGQFMVVGQQCEQRGARRRRGEQRAKEAIGVMPSHEGGKRRLGVLGLGVCCGHGAPYARPLLDAPRHPA
jgi:hypothetical protein